MRVHAMHMHTHTRTHTHTHTHTQTHTHSHMHTHTYTHNMDSRLFEARWEARRVWRVPRRRTERSSRSPQPRLRRIKVKQTRLLKIPWLQHVRI